MTIGAIADLKIVHHEWLDIPVFHRIPHAMMVERLKIENMRGKK